MAKQISSAQWAVNVAVSAATLRGAVKAASTTTPRDAAVVGTITALLDQAEAQLRLGRMGPYTRWRGTRVSLAYQSLHAAEVAFVELMSHEELLARRPAVVRRAQAVLDPADPQRAAVESLLQRTDVTTKAFRADLQEAMRVGYDASDLSHVRVRSFRNMVIAGAVGILILMGVLIALVAFRPEVLPMCFDPAAGRVCPGGGSDPTGRDVLIVAGLGLIGGALAAAFSIRKLRGTSAPYDVPVALAWLKLPLGALTAVTGILLLGGDFVPGLSALDNQAQILAYALLLGYAQQLVSRLIDDQAQAVLNKLPGKDKDADQPPGSAVLTTTVVQEPAATITTETRRRGLLRSRSKS